MQGALARAIAENPALAAQDSSLQRRADKVHCCCCLVCYMLMTVQLMSALPENHMWSHRQHHLHDRLRQRKRRRLATVPSAPRSMTKQSVTSQSAYDWIQSESMRYI